MGNHCSGCKCTFVGMTKTLLPFGWSWTCSVAGQLELKGEAWPFCLFSPRYLPNHRSNGLNGASLTLNICPTLPLNWWWIPRMTGTLHHCAAFRNCFQTSPTAAMCNFLHLPSRLFVYNFLQLITGVFAQSPPVYLSKKKPTKNKMQCTLETIFTMTNCQGSVSCWDAAFSI